jgi:hypothetical protein
LFSEYLPMTEICPLSQIVRTLAALAARDDVDFITPAALPWGGDWDWSNNYPLEYARWARTPGRLDRITILLRHDVDGLPQRTLAMMREERKLGLRSIAFVFVRKVDRPAWEGGRGLAFDDSYIIDDDAWLPYQAAGFEIGYHQNALDQAAGDAAAAEGIGAGDILAMRTRGYKCDFFTPHGGIRFPATNNMLPPPVADSRWLGNGHGIHVAGNFSDSPAGREQYGNLDSFVATLRRGQRYVILLHPQYYGDDLS